MSVAKYLFRLEAGTRFSVLGSVEKKGRPTFRLIHFRPTSFHPKIFV